MPFLPLWWKSLYTGHPYIAHTSLLEQPYINVSLYNILPLVATVTHNNNMKYAL